MSKFIKSDANQDNPAIGLCICNDKNNVMAQYALELSSQANRRDRISAVKIYSRLIQKLSSINEGH